MSSIEEVPPSSPEELADLGRLIDGWADDQVDNPVVEAVERLEDGHRCWFIRVRGDEKSIFSVWFVLHQRSLLVETYVLPAPEERVEEVFAYLLRRNTKLVGMAYTVGEENAVYLRGHVENRHVDRAELDRMLGTAYMETEQSFRPAMRMAFGSRFRG
ncbi:MAG: YbjN domain-containing protein [Microthrixaceae bacterium]